jgi:hypothetical protein
VGTASSSRGCTSASSNAWSSRATYSARAITSGGTLAATDFDQIAGAFLARVREAMPVDAAYFCLHGAMAADGEDDPEGLLLAEVRNMLGEKAPIVVSQFGLLSKKSGYARVNPGPATAVAPLVWLDKRVDQRRKRVAST